MQRRIHKAVDPSVVPPSKMTMLLHIAIYEPRAARSRGEGVGGVYYWRVTVASLAGSLSVRAADAAVSS